MPLLLTVAFVAGLVTVLSPCVLPILPVVLASATGGRKRPLALILGLVVSFALFTLVISQLVIHLGLSGNIIRLAAVAIIGLLGLALIVPALNTRLELLFSRLPGLAPQGQSDAGWRGGLITGATLGLVWAPCAGPILAAVTTLAATQRANLAVAGVALAYAIGAGIPLLLIAYGGQAIITRVPAVSRHTVAIQKVFGGLMIVTAVLIAFNVDVTLSASAASLLPADWSSRLTSIETDPAVTSQLRELSSKPAAQPTVPAAEPATAPTSAVAPTMQPSAPAAQPSAPLARPTTPASPVRIGIPLPNLGPAPDFVKLGNWINSEPLSLAKLRGKVVLVDFWTYSCINCIRTLPYTIGWYEKYKDLGFIVVGVHTPEFSFEYDKANVLQAIRKYQIPYPVAQDNALETWLAFENLYWPASYLIDAKGNLRYTHFGEGHYDLTEKSIQELLVEAGQSVMDNILPGGEVPISREQTPETYIGLLRQDSFMSPLRPLADTEEMYTLPDFLPPNTWAVSGKWRFNMEDASPTQAGNILKFNFVAKDVYLVMTSDKPVTMDVYVDLPEGNHSEEVDAKGQLTVTESRLYHLVSLNDVEQATLTLQFNQPGVQLFAFTFGS